MERQDRSFLAGGGEMGALMRAMDWAKTPIGAIETWSPGLRMMVSFLLANRFPLLLWWGTDYASIYNDAYRPILGAKHPQYLGRPVSECWSEIWHILKPLIDTPFQGGPATWMEDLPLELNRHGFVEETHFTIAYSPVPDETAPRGIGGVLATVHEITEKIVGERRLAVLRDLGAGTGEAKTAQEACTLMAEILKVHQKEVPFALLYLIESDGKRACLTGAAGVAMSESVSPSFIELGEQAERDSPWPLVEAIRSESLVTVEDLGSRFAAIPAGPWSDPPNCAVVVPIKSNMAHQLAGLLVAGVSSRLKLDDRYQSFFELAAAQIATAISNARAYEEERKRAEALAEIDRAKTLFFSNVSHEFRTPLTLMLGPLEEVLRCPSLAGEDQQQLTVAHRNSLRLLKLVNSLLDFSRVEAGRAQAVYHATDLAAVTADLASNFRSACERAGLRLRVDCPPLPEPVHVDRDMWEKIVLNLISNAFKFTFDGDIEVAIRARDGHAELTVRDTGIGIPEVELPRMFERFHRIENARGRTHEGTGIGLALVQELVKLHGGGVHVDSINGKGTTFAVRLPFGTAHLPADRIDAARTQASTATRAEAFVEEALRWLPGGDGAEGFEAFTDAEVPAALGPDTPRVLVADDNADMRDYVRRILSARYKVDAVADGQAALDAARAKRPDLLLADIMMPRLDGFALLKAVRAAPELRDIPVVLLSARAGEEAKIAGLDAGADDYLVKPFSARELLARIGANLEMARVRRETTEKLRESERKFSLLFEKGAFSAALSKLPEGILVDVNEAFESVFGFTRREALGKTSLELGINPDEKARARIAAELIERGFVRDCEMTLYTRAGEARVFLGNLTTIEIGGETHVLSALQDITERKRAEEHRELLINELNHRVKNTLATVQSLARQSLHNAETVADGQAVFNARLLALAKAHDTLTREHWEGAGLREIVADAIAAYADEGRLSRFDIEGPSIRLQPKAALALSMALHELATNAVKYGALSNQTGRVAIGWKAIQDEPQCFRLRWRESGGPPVKPPCRCGFGSRLIEQGLAQDLGGEVRLSFAKAGVVCDIEVPLGKVAGRKVQ